MCGHHEPASVWEPAASGLPRYDRILGADVNATCHHQNGRHCKEVEQMRNEFTAIFERDCEWHIAYCLGIPGANGQGKTKEEARESLAEAIALIGFVE